MSRHTVLATLASAAALAACSDSSTQPDCTVSRVVVTGAPAEMTVGSMAQLEAHFTATDCNTVPRVEWDTSDEHIASVSPHGLVDANDVGEVAIIAIVADRTGSAIIQVIPPSAPTIAQIRITPGTVTLAAGRQHTLVAEALDAEENPIPGVSFTWSSSDDTRVSVDQGTVTGATANTSAVITASADGINGIATVEVVRSRLAFLWNDARDAPGVTTPEEHYSYNSLGGANSVNRISTGRYQASFGGQARENYETEVIMVSGHSLHPGQHCVQENWSSTSLTIGCYDAAGAPVDAYWTSAHISTAAFQGRMGYTWISSATSHANGHPSYTFNSAGGSVRSEYTGTGVYRVTFAGLGRAAASDREVVMVNGYGSTTACQPAEWETEGPDLVVRVRCFGVTGAPANSPFTVLVVSEPRDGAMLAFALDTEPSEEGPTGVHNAIRPSGNVALNRLGLGSYVVNFFGFERTGTLKETFLVTPIGDDPARCTVSEWAVHPLQSELNTAWVECSDYSGAPADAKFAILGIQ